MVVTNFFKLKLNHPVLKQFAEDHYLLMGLYQKSYDFLDNFGRLEPKTEAESKYYSQIFLDELCSTSKELQDKYDNFLISYHSFKSLAASNKAIEKEFKKLPKNINDLTNHFENMLGGYQIAISETKKALENAYKLERGE